MFPFWEDRKIPTANVPLCALSDMVLFFSARSLKCV